MSVCYGGTVEVRDTQIGAVFLVVSLVAALFGGFTGISAAAAGIARDPVLHLYRDLRRPAPDRRADGRLGAALTR